jgi:hypothetical protein
MRWVSRDRLHVFHVTRAARERLRNRFRPARVRVLFVGESPPAAGSFFYAADSELYRATRDAFEAALPEFRNADSFLNAFAESGCYLVDLALDPVNQLTNRNDGSWKRRAQARARGEARLAATLADLQPAIVIVVLKGIVANVTRAADRAGIATESYALTYPSRWNRHRLAYRNELSRLLRTIARRKVL